MKVGDLVRARHDLDDNQGFVKKGMVGIVTKRTQTGSALIRPLHALSIRTDFRLFTLKTPS